MGRTISKRNRNNLYKKVSTFFLLLISTWTLAQTSYTNQWFLKHSDHLKTDQQNKDSLLPDIPKNAWHNARISLAKKDYSRANYYWLKDNQTNDTLKEALQAHILLRLGVLDEAKTHFKNLLATQDLDLKQFLSKSLGDLYYKNKQYDSAQVYYQKAFQIPVEQSRYFTIEIHENLAYIKLSEESYKEALTSYQKILNIYKDFQDSLSIARTYSNVGNLYFEQYKDELALQYFDSAYAAATSLNDLYLKSRITNNLYLVNEALQQKDAAVKYLKENVAIKDSLQRQNHLWEIAKQQETFALTKKQSELDVKTAERNTFFVITLAILIILVIGFLAYQRLSKQHKKIQQLNTKLDKLNSTKDQLFTIIAHDLRSPVALLKQSFQIQKFQQKESQSSINPDIPKMLDSLSMLLDNLLNWALSQSSLLQVHKDWFPLQPILKQIQEQYDALIQEKNIEFSLNVSRSILVYGDMELLKVALRNCLDNAIKFTPEGGFIEFSESLKDQQYILSLTDSGVGIPEESLSQLFEMNTRKIQKDTTGRKSSGLGLLLTQSMIQLNNGKIQIRQNPTGGTIIDISIPYKQVA